MREHITKFPGTIQCIESNTKEQCKIKQNATKQKIKEPYISVTLY
jgi:invasion protein IalB